MTTTDILQIIGEKKPDIDYFMFHSFPKQQLLQDKIPIWEKKEQKHFEKAITLRNELHLPFWDAIMLSTFNNSDYSSYILSHALDHNPVHECVRVKSSKLSDFSFNDQERMAVCSTVRMKNGDTFHIPMLDFHIPVSDSNLQVVKQVCSLLELRQGFILNSGESYHYIASFTVLWDTLYTILTKALLFCPIIDRAWISHQLQEKSCSLRIDKKNGIQTVLVEVLE